MKRFKEAAEKHADELWNRSLNPNDWAWEDKVRDFQAGAEHGFAEGYQQGVEEAAKLADRHNAYSANMVNAGVSALPVKVLLSILIRALKENAK
jgi:flagellar biosynthesis/type III secretory pathway protein FliH